MGWEEELENALIQSVSGTPSRFGILFSGGLDSSLLAHLSHAAKKDFRLYSSCTKGSHDETWTRRAANILGLQVEVLPRSDDEILEGISSIKEITHETSPLVILIELPLYFITKSLKESTFVTGQGADELFLGYKKYESEDTSKEDLRRVIDYVVPLERKIADFNRKKLVYPYLDGRVVKVASMISYDQNIGDGIRKRTLRSVALMLGLKEEIAMKQKKASQYSSGFRDAVSRIAKERHSSVHELISEL
jgi:asparagine synthase (glutamine-hydrolysing)